MAKWWLTKWLSRFEHDFLVKKFLCTENLGGNCGNHLSLRKMFQAWNHRCSLSLIVVFLDNFDSKILVMAMWCLKPPNKRTLTSSICEGFPIPLGHQGVCQFSFHCHGVKTVAAVWEMCMWWVGMGICSGLCTCWRETQSTGLGVILDHPWALSSFTMLMWLFHTIAQHLHDELGIGWLLVVTCS